MTTYPRIRIEKLLTGEADQYQVVEACRVSTQVLPDGSVRDLIIPEGFVTNMASVPRLLWWLIPPTGLACNASILHDYMYWYVNFYMDAVSAIRARLAVDAEFLKNLILTPGMPVWQAMLMFAAVHVFGKKHWGHYEKVAQNQPPIP